MTSAVKVCPNRQCPDVLNYGAAGEYTQAIQICPTCGATLVIAKQEPGDERDGRARLADSDFDEPEEEQPEELSLAIRAPDHGLVLFVSSLLTDACIPFYTRTDPGREVFRVFAGPASGGVEFWVRSSDLPEALELLSRLRQGG